MKVLKYGTVLFTNELTLYWFKLTIFSLLYLW